MNITKEQADKVIAALSMNRIMARDENGNYTKEITAQVVVEALTIMRGLAEDAGAVKCWCSTCRPITITDMRMVVCPDCGNKRCPKATDHRFLCTNSNESGQTGSSYTSSKSAHAETRNLASIYSKHDSYPVYIGDKHVMTVHATSPQAAQTALQSESSAQAAQAPARLPSEGKPIEALAPQQAAQTEAALREVVRLSEDAGLYDSDFQTGRAGSKP